MIMIGGTGITAGVHRLWTHRAYKAKWPLRVILVICYASAGMVDERLQLSFRALQVGKIFLYKCFFSE